ncbi:MAG: hypothetical protein JXB50_02165, partial [Spirochaetes bacterium]|nr:hypothetical protein [Spirochaetota bacterium]
NICPKELRQRCLKKAENKKTYFKWFGKILNGITFGLFSKINDKIIAGIVGSAITIMLIETIRKAINALTDFFSKIGGTP